MDHRACVNIPELPLQLQLVLHPHWAQQPVAVVTRDTPQGEIMWMNNKARCKGIHTGMRYASALSLTSELRTVVVLESEVRQRMKPLVERLTKFSPDVEPSTRPLGVFWLNVTGLAGLYSSTVAWARELQKDLHALGFRVTIIVGYTRFGTYVVSNIRTGITVFRNLDQERETALEVPLSVLDFPPNLLEVLDRTGLNTVKEFLSLLPSDLRQRFGEEAYKLYQMASSDLSVPTCTHRKRHSLRCRYEFGYPEKNAARVFTVFTQLLYPLLRKFRAQGYLLVELHWQMMLETSNTLRNAVRPAVPTLDLRELLDLVRLRLAVAALPGGVEALTISALVVPARLGQAEFCDGKPLRNLAAADRALARVRTRFGNNTTVSAKLQNGNLPETRFSWEPIHRIRIPFPKPTGAGPLVRRIYNQAQPLPLISRQTIVQTVGPYILSEGWWNAALSKRTLQTGSREMKYTRREYHFARMIDGQLLWVYYDGLHRKWFVHGQVE